MVLKWLKYIVSTSLVLKYMKYTGKTLLWSCNDRIKLLTVNILINNKLRVLYFYYVVAANMTAMPINFLRY